MPERWISALHVDDAGEESVAATRERLKNAFPPGATRRMTRLGLLLGATLQPLAPRPEDTIVYASTYAETLALEAYLDSFPAPSPTLFQTSIHPSAVQQNLIPRQQALGSYFPVTGKARLPEQALLVALLADTPRVILCGGEERGGWLLDEGRASARSFAFSLVLSADPAGALGHISLSAAPAASDAVALPLPVFLEHLRDRRPIDAIVSPGRRLTLRWLA